MKTVSSKFIFACLIMTTFSLLLAGCSLSLTPSTDVEKQSVTPDEQLQPNPNLSPEEVVKIVLTP